MKRDARGESRELFGTPDQMMMDPVHGSIWIYRHEAELIDQPLFQRLRWVTQNDVTSLVFPGAVHNRFLHSLGVLHIADRLWRTVVSHYLSEREHKKRLSGTQIAAANYINDCLRLAALLHDVGHFPFSHLLERESAEFRNLLNAPAVRTMLNSIDGITVIGGESEIVDHEKFSLYCAAHLLTGADVPVDRNDVLAVIDPEAATITDRLTDAIRTLLCALVPSVATSDSFTHQDAVRFVRVLNCFISGPVDVDKMDYLLRDSYFSGVRYGVYNLDHLLSTIRIGFQISGAKPWVGIAIAERGLPALEDFTFSRFQLYQAVYSHKTVVGFKLLLLRAVEEALRDPKTKRRVVDALTDVRKFTNFTESFFWEALRAQAEKDADGAAARLLRREHLHFIVTTHDNSEIENERLLVDLRGDSERMVVKKDVAISFFEQQGSDNHNPPVMLLVTNATKGRRELASIESRTDFFDSLKAKKITHFYRDIVG